MSEQSGFIKPNFPRRVLLILPYCGVRTHLTHRRFCGDVLILLGLWLTTAFWFFSNFGIGL
jgi:hypothetical protein